MTEAATDTVPEAQNAPNPSAIPPDELARDYADRFAAVFPALAARHAVALYPFFLDGVAARPELNQPDGIHPNPAGVATMVERILPAIRALLDS